MKFPEITLAQNSVFNFLMVSCRFLDLLSSDQSHSVVTSNGLINFKLRSSNSLIGHCTTNYMTRLFHGVRDFIANRLKTCVLNRVITLYTEI